MIFSLLYLKKSTRLTGNIEYRNLKERVLWTAENTMSHQLYYLNWRLSDNKAVKDMCNELIEEFKPPPNKADAPDRKKRAGYR